MKKNQMPLFWIISSIYTMVKETNTRILFWRKMNIGHFYQIKDLFMYIPPKPLVSNRHYDIWIMKWCFLFENVGVIYPKA